LRWLFLQAQAVKNKIIFDMGDPDGKNLVHEEPKRPKYFASDLAAF